MIKIWHRKLNRLVTGDYSRPGWYFVTVCTQKRWQILGEINKEKMILNKVGCMVNEIIRQFNKFGNVVVDVYCVMPNHIHMVLIVGADPCVCPKNGLINMPGSMIRNMPGSTPSRGGQAGSTPTGITTTLGQYIKRFKTLTTRIYIKNVRKNGWEPFKKRIWQRNYYDRIVRNEEELNKIRKYIKDNPKMWDRDRNNLNI